MLLLENVKNAEKHKSDTKNYALPHYTDCPLSPRIQPSGSYFQEINFGL